MNNRIADFLFQKHILVATRKGENQVETLYALLNQLNVKVTSGFKYACPDMIEQCANMLGKYIPKPFYQGFPQTVRSLTPEQRLFDQIVHYTRSYGFGDFEHVGHSLFEDAIERSAFSEEELPHEFVIQNEVEASKSFLAFCDAFAAGSRPLNPESLQLLCDASSEYNWVPEEINSKHTACTLLWHTKNMEFASFLSVTDVIKLVDYINWTVYGSGKLNKLNLPNQTRKFITKVLNKVLERKTSYKELQECIEKRQTWTGLLHHIHYVPRSENGKAFTVAIHNEDIRSAYSRFEKEMKSDVVEAAAFLKDKKGNGALLRNLNYIVCNTGAQETKQVLDMVEAKSPLVIMQMQNMYRNYEKGPRTFKFTRHERIRTHREEERKSVLTDARVQQISELLEHKLERSLKGRVNKVYIAPGMERIGVPMNMSASESGFGILPTGSRIKLPEGKKIRAFTYWEKANDIDLSCFGIDEDGSRTEFSWRTMYDRQSGAVAYSGDETCGYNGGSEYFDVDIDKVRELYPTMKYMVFCDNVYFGDNFSKIVCRAGWMSRDVLDSGEVYEPKTVKSAYTIDAKTTFAYLFALDLETREVIWLNVADSKRYAVAGESEFDWLYSYFTLINTMNMRKLFTYCANEVVDNPDDADLVIGDIETDKEQIRSYEFEKVNAYLQ